MTTPVLDLDRVTVGLAGRNVVDNVSLSAAGGTLVALTGPNGAGKTSLIRAIAGLVPFAGSIHIDGEPLANLPAGRRARLIGYLPQGHATHWPMTVREIVALGRFPHGATDPRRLPRADADVVDEALDRTGLAALAHRPVTALSGGERARVAIARLIAQDCPIVLADEPTASLDPRYQIAIMALLRTLAGGGKLVLAATHDLLQAMQDADRVLVLDQGRLVRDGRPHDALDAATLAATFGIAALRPLTDNPAPWALHDAG